MPKRLPRARTLKGDPPLAYYDSGAGPSTEFAISLVHGTTSRSEDWENIFPRLATRYRTVAFDLRGHGKSGRAADYSLRAFADDMRRVLRDVSKGPTVVIGHSLGALLALAAAAESPDLVKGLVLEDPALDYGSATPVEAIAPMRDAIAGGDAVAIRKMVEKLPLPSPGPRGERNYGEMRGFYAAERVVTYLKDVDPAFFDSRTKAEETRPLIDGWLARVAVPTLIIAGEPRLGSRVNDAVEWQMKKAIKDLTVKRFPGTGHVIHGYRPEQFLENIEPFLRNLRG